MDTHGEEKQDSAAAALLSTSGDSVDDHGDLVNSAVVRGKRTKRQRSQQPVLSLAITSPDSSSSASSATAAVDVPALTQEEEDMAHCLILLAQGRAFEPPKLEPAVARAPATVPAPAPDKFTSRRFAEAATTTNGKAGFYVYECKTCRKCFPSFQALGGHRTSHKKPKTMAVAPPPAENLLAGDDLLQISMNSFARPLASAKSKVHECAICGSEFSSGQALGGHMRRHRPLLAAGDMQGSKKEKTFLSLDLNLPASPAADEQRCPPPSPSPSISLGSKQPLVFSPPASAPALAVHCHY